MTRKELERIINKYSDVESTMSKLFFDYGINVYNSMSENFYNKYNYIICKLFEHLFGNDGRELIEKHVFENHGMTFDELCEKLNINE